MRSKASLSKHGLQGVLLEPPVPCNPMSIVCILAGYLCGAQQGQVYTFLPLIDVT